eukprot:m.93629 g.93629  ORF g.93629 m.93629 type:complete len:345 (-) comp26648_c0_seq1:39-1073(-)
MLTFFVQKGACTPLRAGGLVLTVCVGVMVVLNALHIFHIGNKDAPAHLRSQLQPLALREVSHENQLQLQQSIAHLQSQMDGMVANLSKVHTMLQGLVAVSEQGQKSNSQQHDLASPLNKSIAPEYGKLRGTAAIIEFRSNVANMWRAVQTAHDTIHREPQGEWQLVVIHGSANKAWVTESMPVELKDQVTLWHDTTMESPDKCKYNQFRLKRQFWEQFQTEFILNFEADAWFNPASKHMISDFYDWDYVGAPWSTSAQKTWGMPDVGGNGGLVLSTRKMRIDVVDNCTINKSECEHEDIWFSACGKKEYGDKYKFAREDVAKKFVVETVYYDDPIGYHKPSVRI